MEVPSIIPQNNEKRRLKGVEERRAEKHRHHSCRRGRHDRRFDVLGRFLISMFCYFGLHRLEEQVRTLSERQLLGPVFMFISAIIYFFVVAGDKGWVIAGIMVFALMVHECGHFLFTKLCKLRPHWWWFWPILGALMRLAHIITRSQEAIIATGGPLLGGVISALVFGLWLLVPDKGYWSYVLFQLAIIPTLINLFNLIPIPPLDGGRMVQASFPWFRRLAQWFGIAVLLAVSYFTRQPVLLLVWIIIVIERFIDFPVKRFGLALLLLFVMAIFVWSGYGNLSRIEGMTFIGFGTVLVIMCRPNEEAYLRRQKSGKKHLPELSFTQKLAWMMCWITLTSLLAALFWIEILYGPPLA